MGATAPGEIQVLVLTNDDGFNAPGIAALEQAVLGIDWSQLGWAPPPIRMVAPLEHASGCGHQVTTNRPVRIVTAPISRPQPQPQEQPHQQPQPSESPAASPGLPGHHVHAVAGLPADCVRLALHQLAPDVAWVLSGVNAGGNLGVDVFHSGTVAAVREAALHGLRGIALSQYLRWRTIDWERTQRWVIRVLLHLWEQPLPARAFWNVNFPHLLTDDPDPPMVECPLDLSPLPLQFRPHGDEPDTLRYCGDYQNRPRVAGGDVDCCFRGAITLTRIVLPQLEPSHPGT